MSRQNIQQPNHDKNDQVKIDLIEAGKKTRAQSSSLTKGLFSDRSNIKAARKTALNNEKEPGHSRKTSRSNPRTSISLTSSPIKSKIEIVVSRAPTPDKETSEQKQLRKIKVRSSRSQYSSRSSSSRATSSSKSRSGSRGPSSGDEKTGRRTPRQKRHFRKRTSKQLRGGHSSPTGKKQSASKGGSKDFTDSSDGEEVGKKSELSPTGFKHKGIKTKRGNVVVSSKRPSLIPQISGRNSPKRKESSGSTRREKKHEKSSNLKSRKSSEKAKKHNKKKKSRVRFFVEGDEEKILSILARVSEGQQHLNIDIDSVVQFSSEDELQAQEYAPPPGLSPRSAAEYVRNALRNASEMRRKDGEAKSRKKKRHGQRSDADSGLETDKDEKKAKSKTGKKRKKDKGKMTEADKDKKKRKQRRKRRKKKRKKRKGGEEDGGSGGDAEENEEDLRRKTTATAAHDQHFYPTPRFKRRMFVSEATPVVCSICNGIHYRTKRNFAANLRIIVNVNKALTIILQEMKNRMKKIDVNLVRVRKNLEYLEEMYEGVFRRVNRLIVD